MTRMLSFIEKMLAFLWRDCINESSYKLSLLLEFIGVLVSTITYFFLSKILGEVGVSYLRPYGGNYFSFILIGVAFFSYLKISIDGISKSIREGQMLGTLEALLVTQTGIPTIIISSSLYSFMFASLKVAMYLLLGVFAFGVNMENANYAGALIILFLTILSFSSFGILSASFIMVFKKGDPVSAIFTSVSGVLGGVFYPVSVLPAWVQKLSHMLPVMDSLDGMRLSLLQGYSLNELMPNILSLTLFSIIMLPLSLFIFAYAVKRAKIDGTLTQY
ncbi:MAG: type transporter [Candidatus Brocadiaceae bacterium]|nr:type transporter [Candidatus Brocadiaceae bacterium]